MQFLFFNRWPMTRLVFVVSWPQVKALWWPSRQYFVKYEPEFCFQDGTAVSWQLTNSFCEVLMFGNFTVTLILQHGQVNTYPFAILRWILQQQVGMRFSSVYKPPLAHDGSWNKEAPEWSPEDRPWFSVVTGRLAAAWKLAAMERDRFVWKTAGYPERLWHQAGELVNLCLDMTQQYCFPGLKSDSLDFKFQATIFTHLIIRILERDIVGSYHLPKNIYI